MMVSGSFEVFIPERDLSENCTNDHKDIFCKCMDYVDFVTYVVKAYLEYSKYLNLNFAIRDFMLIFANYI